MRALNGEYWELQKWERKLAEEDTWLEEARLQRDQEAAEEEYCAHSA